MRSCAIGWLLASVLEWCKAAAVRRCAACLPACAAGSGHVPLATGRRTGWEIRNGWWTWWFIAIHCIACPRCCCCEETVRLGFHFTLFFLFLFAVLFRWKKPAKGDTVTRWMAEGVKKWQLGLKSFCAGNITKKMLSTESCNIAYSWHVQGLPTGCNQIYEAALVWKRENIFICQKGVWCYITMNWWWDVKTQT